MTRAHGGTRLRKGHYASLRRPPLGSQGAGRLERSDERGDAFRMSSQPVNHDGPIMPMPALTLPALRAAVASLAPGKLAELIAEMQQAFDRAGQDGSTAPIRLFYRRWGTFVAIERIPARAARMHAAEQVLHVSDSADERQAAIHEIGTIVQVAEREVEALETG